MDAFSDPAVHTVVIMSSAQVGKTEIVLNAIGFFADQDPAPILVLQPTIEMGEAFSKDRLAPMLRDTPALRDKVKDPRARDSGNTLLHKSFPGGHITIAGANSAASLASRPIRVLLSDEVDRYPASAGTEGDPLSLARKRTTTFWNRKILVVSTPTVKGASRIEAAYEESDRRVYLVPCPSCGHEQRLAWQQVRWPDGRPEAAEYACEGCGSLWGDAARWGAVRRGRWEATGEFRGVAGFHLSELYSPWRKLGETARDFVEAKDHPERLRTWVNTALGETWQEQGEAPEWRRLADRREAWRAGTVPEDALILTAGADVQKDRVEVDVWAWGRGLESWLIDHIVVPHGPDRAECWSAMDEVLVRTWRHASGADMRLTRLAIDTGYETAAVYAWARSAGFAVVAPVKGVEGFSRSAPVTGPTYVDATVNGRKLKKGARLWTVATATFKSDTYQRLRQEWPTPEERAAGAPMPPGAVHLPTWVDDEWLKQLTAEQLVTGRTRQGFERREWQKMRERNEALDCRVYARAAAWIVGADRWSESQWAKLSVGLRPQEPLPQRVPQTTPPPPSAPRRRVVRSSYMG